MDDKTGAQLDDHEVRTYLEFAGERAYITKDEMVRIICMHGQAHLKNECNISVVQMTSNKNEIFNTNGSVCLSMHFVSGRRSTHTHT